MIKKMRVGATLVLLLLVLGVGVVLGTGIKAPSFGAGSETRSTQFINSITREEQVVLLSLGIQGIDEKAMGKSKFFGLLDIPGTAKTKYLEYGFKAKLGIEGKDVEIEEVGEQKYVVTIPKFIFIGHDNETFRLITEKNGVLSFLAPEVDSVEMINDILSSGAQADYIETNKGILQDQAKMFYTSIITAIDPTVSVTFEFRD